jgi:hypothetical protein
MTSVVQGRTVTLVARMRAYPDGPLVDVTGLTITITPIAGGAAVVGPTSVGITHPGTGTYGYPWATADTLPKGDYLAAWAGTYLGDPVAADEVVTVLARPAAGAYASVDDLNDWLGSTPANAALLLVRASRDVNRALLCAVYEVDDDGLPTSDAYLEALRMATLEQVAGNLGAGNTSGLGRTSGGFTLGRLSVQRATGGSDAASPVKIGALWEQAWNVLQQAGLTGDGPSEPGYC